MSFGAPTKQQILDALCGGTALDLSAASLTLALAKVAIVDTDTGSTITRPTYTGYADISVSTGDFAAAASDGTKANGTDLTFGACTAGAGELLIAFALLDGTQILAHGTVPSHAVATGRSPRFPAGALVLTLDA